ncbi:hypothetical protein HBH56_144000 [Parastagonospora nodorum]|uniref:ThuA-like domain-containing protein n=1 Tax=Phaeosphaeria nodorum (strain SN15 / ATCC MYA-4574 / FGSC 10173) TaxID=321614 RepID=A0A7U2F9Y6_PHANO|nr:hypothetical protein HBH56_144000 [Parastagonospora nodorum]QRD01441.1 hypothetical protein JI435_121010 [Parastagonospora nodorum SN15]KAH3927751.1 hypothetical protein HBH54_149190 [Parastagonospora nodorum]KAH3961913.1 hypothetical protein HBH51_177840 [Parastagonospora nodorum]KAH3971064.1 hypothetical protein HBH52_162310 [Parastagonospora nodorum]
MAPTITPTPPFRVLVFTKTSGYRHDSIPASIRALHSLAETTKHFTLTATEDATLFTPALLAPFSVIILLQTLGPIFTPLQLSALKNFVRAGGGVVAIHAAAAGMPGDAWYAKLCGAAFDMHPPPSPGTLIVEKDNEGHFVPSNSEGREGWVDEWYNFTSHPRENGNLEILLRGDTSTFEGGKMGEDHPLAWCQEFEGGRSFYIALGHFDEAWGDAWFLGWILRGVVWTGRREDVYSADG